MTQFNCAWPRCCKTIHHLEDGNCPSDANGHCAILIAKGWRPVYVRIFLEPWLRRKAKPIVTHGAWICPKHEFDADGKRTLCP
jgi:hypothetical protein